MSIPRRSAIPVGLADPMPRPPQGDPTIFNDMLDKTEGGGDYDALFGFSNRGEGPYAGTAVSKMTLGEIDKFSKRDSKSGYGLWVASQMKNLKDESKRWKAHDTRISTPMGRYQIVGQTVVQLQREMGLRDDEVFSPDMQNRMLERLLKNALEGKVTAKGKREALRAVWEGFKDLPNAELDKAIKKYERGFKAAPAAQAWDTMKSSDGLRNAMDFGERQSGIDLFDGSPTRVEPIHQPKEIGVFDAMVSSFYLENDVWNAGQVAFMEFEQDAFEYDPNFHLTAEMLTGTPFELRPDLVIDAGSQAEFDFLHRWYTRELKHRQIVEASGGKGIAFSMLAGLLSPLSLIPFGAGRAAASVLRGTVRGARAGVLGVGASETVLQVNQEFRPWTETAFGITGGTVLMGAVGALGGKIGKTQFKRANLQADMLLGERVQAVVEDGEFSYISTLEVRQEIRRIQEQTGNSLFLMGEEALSRTRLRQIFRDKGKKVKTEDVSGMLDDDLRMLISTREMDTTRNVIAGWDADVDPRVFKMQHREAMLDREAVEGFMDEAVEAPIQPGDLTPAQQRILELEETPDAVRTSLLEELTELRARIDRPGLSTEQRDELIETVYAIQNDIERLDNMAANRRAGVTLEPELAPGGKRIYRFDDGTEITIASDSHLDMIEVPEGLRRQGVATGHIREVEAALGHRLETGTAGSEEGLALMERLGIEDVSEAPQAGEYTQGWKSRIQRSRGGQRRVRKILYGTNDDGVEIELVLYFRDGILHSTRIRTRDYRPGQEGHWEVEHEPGNFFGDADNNMAGGRKLKITDDPNLLVERFDEEIFMRDEPAAPATAPRAGEDAPTRARAADPEARARAAEEEERLGTERRAAEALQEEEARSAEGRLREIQDELDALRREESNLIPEDIPRRRGQIRAHLEGFEQELEHGSLTQNEIEEYAELSDLSLTEMSPAQRERFEALEARQDVPEDRLNTIQAESELLAEELRFLDGLEDGTLERPTRYEEAPPRTIEDIAQRLSRAESITDEEAVIYSRHRIEEIEGDIRDDQLSIRQIEDTIARDGLTEGEFLRRQELEEELEQLREDSPTAGARIEEIESELQEMGLDDLERQAERQGEPTDEMELEFARLELAADIEALEAQRADFVELGLRAEVRQRDAERISDLAFGGRSDIPSEEAVPTERVTRSQTVEILQEELERLQQEQRELTLEVQSADHPGIFPPEEMVAASARLDERILELAAEIDRQTPEGTRVTRSQTVEILQEELERRRLELEELELEAIEDLTQDHPMLDAETEGLEDRIFELEAEIARQIPESSPSELEAALERQIPEDPIQQIDARMYEIQLEMDAREAPHGFPGQERLESEFAELRRERRRLRQRQGEGIFSRMEAIRERRGALTEEADELNAVVDRTRIETGSSTDRAVEDAMGSRPTSMDEEGIERTFRRQLGSDQLAPSEEAASAGVQRVSAGARALQLDEQIDTLQDRISELRRSEQGELEGEAAAAVRQEIEEAMGELEELRRERNGVSERSRVAEAPERAAGDAPPEPRAPDDPLDQAGRQVEGPDEPGILPTERETGIERFTEDMRLLNGILRELETLSGIEDPSMFERARMIFLRRRFSEFANEDSLRGVMKFYKKHNISVDEIKRMFTHPLKGSIFDDISTLEQFDAEGIIRSRVDRLAMNDAETSGINHVVDPRPIMGVVGIGKVLGRRLADHLGVENVEDVTIGDVQEFFKNGGKIVGFGKGRIEKLLGHEAPPPRGGMPFAFEETPAMKVAEGAFGAHNMPLIVSTPAGRILLRSPNPVEHRALAKLAIVDFKMTGDEPMEEPAELGIKNWHIIIAHSLSEVESLRRKYLMGVRFDEKTAPGRIKTFAQSLTNEEVARRHNLMSQSRWWIAVTKTLRSQSNHAVGVPEAAITHVEEAARIIRRDVWGPVAEQFGFLAKRLAQKGVDPMNYVFRVYNVEKVRAEEKQFRAVVMQDVLKQWNIKYKKAPNVEQMEDLDDMVDAWIDGILTSPYSRAAPNLAEVMMEGKGALGRGGKRRVVDVSDEVLEPWLENDLRDIMAAYMHTRIPDLEIRNMFGDVKMSKVFEQSAMWWAHAIDQAPEVLDDATRKTLKDKLLRIPKTKDELRAVAVQSKQDLEAVRDIMRHTYEIPADPYSWKGFVQRAGKSLREVNYIRGGGGFALTALGDVGGMVLVNGASRTMGDLVQAMSESLGRSTRRSSLSDEELESLGLYWPIISDVLNNRAAGMYQAAEYGGVGNSAIEKALSRNSKRMAQFSLLAPWTNYAKAIAARGVTSRMIEVAEQLSRGAADPDHLMAIHRAYMSNDELLKVLELQKIYGGNEGGVKWLGLEKWRDTDEIKGVRELKRLVRNVIVADVDRAIMTPGAADSSLFFHTMGGKFLLQFKRFGFAHTQRLLMPAMQGARAGNLVIMNGLGISLALGSMVYMLKELANKREVPTDIGRIIQEGVVRSDLWGSIGELDGLTSAVTGGAMGFRNSLGPDTYFSYQGRNYFDNVASHVLGPSYSTAIEGGKALAGIKNAVLNGGLERVSASQMRAWRRILPYQNLFYIEFLFDAMENGMEEAGERKARMRELMDEVI